jgi:hypothetical protein
LLEIFRLEPWFAGCLLKQVSGMDVQTAEVHRQSFDLTKMSPVSYQADAVFTLGEPAKLALIVEIQLGVDDEKRFTWPYYVASLRAREQIPVELLVITDSTRVENWASSPIAVSSSNRWTPLVIGPHSFARIRKSVGKSRQSPHFEVLSLVLSQHDASNAGQPEHSTTQAWQTLETIRESSDLAGETARLYSDTVMRVVPTAVRTLLEKMMGLENYEDKSLLFRNTFGRGYEKGIEEGRQEGIEKGIEKGLHDGRAEGLRRSLYKVVEARSLTLSTSQRRRIDACNDPERLEAWVERALLAEHADAIFR